VKETLVKKVIVTLKSVSPYEQSKHYNVPKLEKESPADYEERTWRNRLHSDKMLPDGSVDPEGEVFIPPMAFKNCLSEAAKYLGQQIPGKGKATYTKHFEAGVMVLDPVPLGIKVKDVPPLRLFVSADGKRGSGKRVDKVFPVIASWSANVTFYVLDETITQNVFQKHIEEAGKFIGIGAFRPRNNGFYGRFEILDVQWAA